MAVKTASKAAVNLASRSRMRNRKRLAGVVEVHEQVAGLLGQPGAGGVGGDAEDVHAAGGVLDDEERVQPVQGDGVEVKQVAGQDRVRLRAQELASRSVRPGAVRGRSRRRGGSSRRWRRRSGSRGRRARRGRVDIPRWGSRWPGAGPGRERRRGWRVDRARVGWVVQRRAISWRCQRRMVAGVTSSPRRRRAGSSRVRAAIRARSVQVIRGRGVRRWSTASWWRRTRISMSLVVSDRVRSTIQPRSLVHIW